MTELWFKIVQAKTLIHLGGMILNRKFFCFHSLMVKDKNVILIDKGDAKYGHATFKNPLKFQGLKWVQSHVLPQPLYNAETSNIHTMNAISTGARTRLVRSDHSQQP
jgi:hypothetical protein